MSPGCGIAFIGASSSIGIRPYDDGEVRHSYRAPEVLRELGLVARLQAIDLGDVFPGPYVDFVRAPGLARNEGGIVRYSRLLAERVAQAIRAEQFALVIGGECSVVLGSLLGARAARMSARESVGLVYIDGHADFASPSESVTGSVASMCLAMAVGRGDTPLARLAGAEPLVDARHAVLVGRRDHEDAGYGHDALNASAIEDITGSDDDRASLLSPLVRHPKARGMELTIYDPKLDPGLECGRQLVDLLERVLRPDGLVEASAQAPNATRAS